MLEYLEKYRSYIVFYLSIIIVFNIILCFRYLTFREKYQNYNVPEDILY